MPMLMMLCSSFSGSNTRGVTPGRGREGACARGIKLGLVDQLAEREGDFDCFVFSFFF
jgi:hypothetical protein